MLNLKHIAYAHPNQDVLFQNIDLSLNKNQKIAIVGNNGVGKSTLLKIIAGELSPSEGKLTRNSDPYYVPQLFGQHNHLTVAQALGIDDKLHALKEILAGNMTEHHLTVLNDDWTIEDRCEEALAYWQLTGLDLFQPLAMLSGGQKTKIYLAGITIHRPEIVLLDEPSNHLDLQSRQLLYRFITNTTGTLIVVSHDRTLLNLMDTIGELGNGGISIYGGNYTFYETQKQAAKAGLLQNIHHQEKTLRQAREKERAYLERQQKSDAKGKHKQEKAGVARIMMNTLKNKAEQSTSKSREVHGEKIAGITEQLHTLRSSLPDIDQIKFDFKTSNLHNGKVIFSAKQLHHRYHDNSIWETPLDLQIKSGDRIAIKGANGSGKTTLLQIILGNITASGGTIQRTKVETMYIDQEYALIQDQLSVYEQAQHFNKTGLQEHEIKTRLNYFLFHKQHWDKPCQQLSGGEKMRLLLCGLVIQQQAPNLLILDEPTNNLDMQNVAILTNALQRYEGTLIVISHDEYFLDQIRISAVVTL